MLDLGLNPSPASNLPYDFVGVLQVESSLLYKMRINKCHRESLGDNTVSPCINNAEPVSLRPTQLEHSRYFRNAIPLPSQAFKNK